MNTAFDELIRAFRRPQSVFPGEHPSDETLTAYVHESLSKAETESLDEHLEGCPSCTKVAHGLLDIRELFDKDLNRQLDAIYPSKPKARLAVGLFAALLAGLAVGIYLSGTVGQPRVEEARTIHEDAGTGEVKVALPSIERVSIDVPNDAGPSPIEDTVDDEESSPPGGEDETPQEAVAEDEDTGTFPHGKFRHPILARNTSSGSRIEGDLTSLTEINGAVLTAGDNVRPLVGGIQIQGSRVDGDLQTQAGPSNKSSESLHYYLQDSWQHKKWSVNAGFRAEDTTFVDDLGNDVGTWDTEIAPRISVSYDIKGDGRSSIGVFYGEYYDAYRDTAIDFAGSLNGRVIEEQVYVDALGDWVNFRFRGAATPVTEKIHGSFYYNEEQYIGLGDPNSSPGFFLGPSLDAPTNLNFLIGTLPDGSWQVSRMTTDFAFGWHGGGFEDTWLAANAFGFIDDNEYGVFNIRGSADVFGSLFNDQQVIEVQDLVGDSDGFEYSGSVEFFGPRRYFVGVPLRF